MTEDQNIKGRVALVTGSGSGIGKATALRLARNGARIGLLGRTEEELANTAAEIAEFGGEAMVLVADVGHPDAMKRAIADLIERFGRLDIVVANAGVNGVWAGIDDLQPDEWNETIRINLTGTYLTIHNAVPYLRKAGGGAIVITASINGTRTFSNTGATAYSCTKAAQMAMGKMLALELAKDRIRVNVVCPGQIDTEIQENTHARHIEKIKEPVEFPESNIPLTDGRPGTSDDVADLIAFLVSPQSKHITGTPVWIDGGQSLMLG